MTDIAPVERTEERAFRRVIGTYEAGLDGPTLLVLSGIHGNEPAGVHAMRRLLGRLRADSIPLRGRVVAAAGNLKALEARQRFLHRDLNRQWLRRSVRGLLARDPAHDGLEDAEQRDLLQVFEQVQETATGPTVFLDLHTSSAAGAPFTCLGDTLDNRRVALSIPIPVILGLEECIDGAVMEYFNERGLLNLAIEGGQHDLPSTVDNLEAAVWTVLASTGMLPPGAVDLEPFEQRLRQAARGLPRVVEVRYRHLITPEHGFAMEPGFQSFQCVPKETLLARDQSGELRTPNDCRLLLPLYQGQGEDGYFLCRDVKPVWLKVAWLLRRLGLPRIVHWFPGVCRDPEDPNSLLVEHAVARWFVPQVFHLLGFRRKRVREGKLLFTRRWSRAENGKLRRR